MVINKQTIGNKKIDKKQIAAGARRQSEVFIGSSQDRILLREPIEVMPSIKGLKRKMSSNSDHINKINENSKQSRLSHFDLNNKVQLKLSSVQNPKFEKRPGSQKQLLAPEEMQINNVCLQLCRENSGRFEKSQFIDFFEDDKVQNVKMTTNEKLRLIKRREIVKSMKFIRKLGRELRQ